jgi:hypothetical protein
MCEENKQSQNMLYEFKVCQIYLELLAPAARHGSSIFVVEKWSGGRLVFIHGQTLVFLSLQISAHV